MTNSSQYIALVLGNIANETQSTTLQVVLKNVVLAANCYTTPERRDEARHILADILWQLAQNAEAGSDAQLQFLTSFASVAEASSHIDDLAALYSGSLTFEGLEVDSDLAWQLLIGLVASGHAGGLEIDELLSADNTVAGQQSAAHARAAIQTRERKEQAWASIVETNTATNSIVKATAEGFLRVNDPSLLEPFMDRYFGAIEGIWKERSYAIAEKLVSGLYPSPLVSQKMVDAGRAWLDAHPDMSSLRRLVMEHLSDTERALVAQRRDAQP